MAAVCPSWLPRLFFVGASDEGSEGDENEGTKRREIFHDFDRVCSREGDFVTPSDRFWSVISLASDELTNESAFRYFFDSLFGSSFSPVVHGLCRAVSRHDADLGRQLKRAINSVGLNCGEGFLSRGGSRTARLESAMASGREVIFGLRIAGAAGYLPADRVAKEVDTIDRIVATLYKLTYRCR